MINYIKADFYRIFSRKSLYIFFASLMILYFLAVFITSSALNADKVLSQGDYLFMFLAILRWRVFVFGYI